MKLPEITPQLMMKWYTPFQPIYTDKDDKPYWSQKAKAFAEMVQGPHSQMESIMRSLGPPSIPRYGTAITTTPEGE
jgi:hypothetical protein